MPISLARAKTIAPHWCMMGTVRKPFRCLAAPLLLTAGLLADCGGSESPSSAVVTGTASPCVGVTTASQYVKIPVQVTIKREGRTVARETLTGNHIYRFVIPPGRYVVESDQIPTYVDVFVALTSGETDHVDLFPKCK